MLGLPRGVEGASVLHAFTIQPWDRSTTPATTADVVDWWCMPVRARGPGPGRPPATTVERWCRRAVDPPIDWPLWLSTCPRPRHVSVALRSRCLDRGRGESLIHSSSFQVQGDMGCSMIVGSSAPFATDMHPAMVTHHRLYTCTCSKGQGLAGYANS
jgi:hypothetical protein